MSARILILGAAGMIGRKLTERLAKDGGLAGQALGAVTLHDIVETKAPALKARVVASDLSAPGEAEKLVADRPDLIFHLAAIVSGEAEADFEKGYRINLDGTRRLFEAVRKQGGGAAGSGADTAGRAPTPSTSSCAADQAAVAR